MIRSDTGAPAEIAQWGAIDATTIVVAFHGRGQSPEDIKTLSARVGESSAQWWAPSAPGGTWYAPRFMDDAALTGEDARWAVDSAAAILTAAAATAGRTIALGFSQGACLLAECVLTRTPPVDGVAVLTGGYFGPRAREFTCALPDLPAVLATSEHDEWVPLSRVNETRIALETAGARVTMLVAEGGAHGVTDDAVIALRTLITTDTEGDTTGR